jgi:uncharacterized protein
MTNAFDDLMMEIGHAPHLPAAELVALMAHAPKVLEAVRPLAEHLRNGAWISPVESQQLLYGLHVLACAQHGPAWSMWQGLLSDLDDGALEALFGDGGVFSVTRITMGLVQGQGVAFDPAALATMAADPAIGAEVRWSLLEVLARHIAEGRFAREAYLALIDGLASQSWDEEGYAWAVENAIVLAGIEERAELMSRLHDTPAFAHFRQVDKTHAAARLAEAAAAPNNLSRFDEAGIRVYEVPGDCLHWLAKIIELNGPEPDEGTALGWREVCGLDEVLRRPDNPPETMRFEELDGLLHALVMGPDIVMPSEYLPLVWGEGPVFEDMAEANLIVGLIQRHWNAIAARRMAEAEFAPHLERQEGMRPGLRWAKGFMEGVALRHEAWSELDNEPELAVLLQDIEWLAIADRLGDSERHDVLSKLGQHLRTLSMHWQSQVRSPGLRTRHHAQRPFWEADKPAPIRVDKIGRNEPCPCGSGKKWKKCCGQGPADLLH